MRGRILIAVVTAMMAVACQLPGTPSGSTTPFVRPTATPTVPLQTRRPSPTPTSSVPTATAPPTYTPTATTSPYLGVEVLGGELGGVWNLADIRAGTHPESVRVVFEMAQPGTHVPYYRAVEVDNEANPFPGGHDPSWGAARIDVFLSDVYAYQYPLEEELPIELPEGELVIRVGSYPTYDDDLLGFSIGLLHPAEYEVSELTSPVRIVVDVFYSG